MHYDINGDEISIIECERCKNQLGFMNSPFLINGNHAEPDLLNSTIIVNELTIINRGMKDVCCEKPVYYYRTD